MSFGTAAAPVQPCVMSGFSSILARSLVPSMRDVGGSKIGRRYLVVGLNVQLDLLAGEGANSASLEHTR